MDQRHCLVVPAVLAPVLALALTAPAGAAPGREAPAVPGASVTSTPSPRLGDERRWAAVDNRRGREYWKDFTLRGIGEHIEVWVASDRDDVSAGIRFPEGDCRNDERVQITDAQIRHLMDEFDRRILPAESRLFSVAPHRDGSRATLPARLGLPADYYRGEGDNVVVLVDNVRDTNFYDRNLARGDITFTAGFFYPTFNKYFDRNVMTIDAYDWLHRSGANPPDEPVPGDHCASKPARPNSYEATFAHEYQHLLLSYQDASEVPWLNEALSQYAVQAVGYATPQVPVTRKGHDVYIQCLLGNSETQTRANPNPRKGGPENSLTVWGDQGQGSELLCDYGAGYSFLLHLAGRLGREVITELHRDRRHGLGSLAAVLERRGAAGGVATALHQWQAMLALDAALESPDVTFLGDRTLYSTPELRAAINWDNDDAYATPGAPPNGADYVRLRDGHGRPVRGDDVVIIGFDGSERLPPSPMEWVVAPDPTGRRGDPALFSGRASNLDRAAISSVTVPAAEPVLTFESRWAMEPEWDFGFVQVSSDGGATWTSLANAATTREHEAGAVASVVKNLPGFTGSSKGWTTQRFDLSRWAGRQVLLAFRHVTDANTEDEGWWVDDVTIGGRVVSDGSTLAGLRSATQVDPVEVAGFTVQLVGYPSSGRGPAFVLPLPLDARFDGFAALPGPDLLGIDVVAAIVAYDEPTETVTGYAPYTLTVNGVVQPGGGGRVGAPPAAPP